MLPHSQLGEDPIATTTCGAPVETFHDLIAKVVFEYERVGAENSQLVRTMEALQMSQPESSRSPAGAAVMPVATIPVAPKGSPKPSWTPVARHLPMAAAFPVREAHLPTITVPQEAPWSSDASAEIRFPSSGSTAFAPSRIIQTVEEIRAQRLAQTGAHASAASRNMKFKGNARLGVARTGSTFTTPLPRQSGRFAVQKSVSFDEKEKQGGSSTTLMTLGLPDSWKRMLHESSCALAARRIVDAPAFNCTFSLAVVAYAVFIGYETAWVARNLQHQSQSFDVVHGVFNLVFLVELILRFATNVTGFFFGEAWRWNVLDFVLVVASAVDFFILRSYMQVTHNSGGIRTLRFARILRLMRTIRILRAVKSVHELHKMLYSFLSSMRTLFCASLVLFFVMYFFSILFTVASAEQRSVNATTDGPLDIFYGTLGRTFKSLFWSMSNGKSWSEIYEPIAEIHWAYGFCFFSYIIIVMFGVLNVVSSVFVESALLSAQYYSDLIIKDKEYEKAIASSHMMAVFRQMDQKGSGEISRSEMDFVLEDANLRQYLEALDLSADDTRMLFRLLDQDCSGVIDMDEFCSGCLKLKGPAKSIDVHILMLQLHRFLKKWSDFTEYVEDQFIAVDKAVSDLERSRPKTRDDV